MDKTCVSLLLLPASILGGVIGYQFSGLGMYVGGFGVFMVLMFRLLEQPGEDGWHE